MIAASARLFLRICAMHVHRELLCSTSKTHTWAFNTKFVHINYGKYLPCHTTIYIISLMPHHYLKLFSDTF
jgi:hypothetical protein